MRFSLRLKTFVLIHILALTLALPEAFYVSKISPSFDTAKSVNSEFNTDVTLLYLSILDNSSSHIEAVKGKPCIFYLHFEGQGYQSQFQAQTLENLIQMNKYIQTILRCSQATLHHQHMYLSQGHLL